MEEYPVLCVGLVCIDKFLVLESFPQEDSDQPALEAYQSRGGNASNNCTILAQLVPKVEFLGTFPKPRFGNQYDFVIQDFRDCKIELNTQCPMRQNFDWPGKKFKIEVVTYLSNLDFYQTCFFRSDWHSKFKIWDKNDHFQ